MRGKDKRAAVKKLKSLVFTQKAEPIPFRNKIESQFSVFFLPNNVERTEKNYNSVVCDLLRPVAFAKERLIIYIHGGSFVGGSRASWRSFASSLAHASATELLLPEIRLAPEYPFPSALDDIEAVFTALSKDTRDIILCGDGTGGTIALSFALFAKKTLRDKIKKLVLFSPFLDFSPDSALLQIKKISDALISTESIRRMADTYTYASNLANPMVSPLCASEDDLKNLKQVYIQMGEDEIILPDARRFATKLGYAAVPHILDVWPGMIHFFQMADDCIPEAHKAIEKVAAFIKCNEEL